jgi:general transcription factor 3C polypeptide 3 (transcription factor C subunit 4)
LNIYLGLLSTTAQPNLAICIIHSTSRWLHGRSSETFWDFRNDSREWDEDDIRRSEVPDYDPTKWDTSRYTLPMEIRIRLGINWVQAQNLPEAMVHFS